LDPTKSAGGHGSQSEFCVSVFDYAQALLVYRRLAEYAAKDIFYGADNVIPQDFYEGLKIFPRAGWDS